MALLTYMQVGIEYDENVLTPAKHAKLMRELMYEAGRTHRLQNLPKHFQENSNTAPGGAYGYTARSEKWKALKNRRWHKKEPLVASGRMRAEVMFNANVTATQYKTSIKIRNYFPMIPQRRKELESIAPEELDALAATMRANYVRLSATSEYRRTRRVKR